MPKRSLTTTITRQDIDEAPLKKSDPVNLPNPIQKQSTFLTKKIIKFTKENDLPVGQLPQKNRRFRNE